MAGGVVAAWRWQLGLWLPLLGGNVTVACLWGDGKEAARCGSDWNGAASCGSDWKEAVAYGGDGMNGAV